MFISIFKQTVLQKFRYLVRWLRDEKVPPSIILPIVIFLFSYFSYLIVVKKHAVAVYVFGVLLLIFNTISKEKKQFYQQQFSPSIIYWLQTIELSIVALPAILFLLIYKYVLYVLLVISIIIIFPFLNIQKYNFHFIKIIHAPYLKESYEMNFGFRATLLANIILSIFLIMSIYVGNANLFLGVLVIYACIQAFISYSIFEEPIFLRQYFLSPQKIIFIKFKQVVINHLIFLLVSIAGSLFFMELKISLLVLLIVLFSIMYNCLTVLLKYSFFQHDFINASAQLFLLRVFFIVPVMPLFALLFPFLYYILFNKATNNLKRILS